MKKLSGRVILLSYLIFFAGWTVRVVFADFSGWNEVASYAVKFLIRALWWPVYAIFLIKRYSGELEVPWKEMCATKPRLKILLPLLAFAALYHVGVYFFDSSGFGLETGPFDFALTVLTVGFLRKRRRKGSSKESLFYKGLRSSELC